MAKKSDIPTHHYDEAIHYIKHPDETSHLSLDPQMPFVLAKFELMQDIAQANYPHRHNCYQVLYISEGEGTHTIDFVPYPVAAPTLFFLSKEQVHYWQLSKPLKGYILLIPEEFLGFPSSKVVRTHDFSVFNYVGESPHLPLDKEHFTMINGLFEAIADEFYRDKDRSLSVLRAYLHILLTKLHRLYMIEHPSECSAILSPLVRQFKQLVSEHFTQEHSVQDYANRIGVSTSHLKDTVKAVTGSAPGTMIREKLILEAKRSLVHSDATVAEIGYSLNFEDASYFGRFFKRETGISPIAFRQQYQQKHPTTAK